MELEESILLISDYITKLILSVLNSSGKLDYNLLKVMHFFRNSLYALARKASRINLNVIQTLLKNAVNSCIKVYHLLSLLEYCT